MTDFVIHRLVRTHLHRVETDTHTRTQSKGVFMVTPVCVVRSGKCLTNYMPIMFGMSASALPGSNASAHTCIYAARADSCVNLPVICRLNFRLILPLFLVSRSTVSVMAPRLKCLTSSWPQPFCLLLICSGADQRVKSASCPVPHCV